MNWETIITALIAGVLSPLIMLVPVYWQRQKELQQRKVEREDTARTAKDELIRQLQEKNDDLEKDKEELQEKYDLERERRRKVEEELLEARIELRKCKAEIEKPKEQSEK